MELIPWMSNVDSPWNSYRNVDATTAQVMGSSALRYGTGSEVAAPRHVNVNQYAGVKHYCGI